MRAVEPDVRKCGENPIKLEDSVNLVVDIGNSRIKLGVVDGGRIEDTFCVETLEESLLDDIFSRYPVDKAIAVCSAGGKVRHVRRQRAGTSDQSLLHA